MEVLHARCCGIDVHKASLVACLRVQDGRRASAEVQSFGTTTAEIIPLHALAVGRRAPTWRWNRPASIGSRSSICSRAARCGARQCASHQGGSRSQDGRERLRVARRLARAWADPRQLYPPGVDSRAARADPASEEPDSR